jgi:hypothetical protein
VSIYFACAKPTFTAVTPGLPPKLLYKKDVGADATGMFDLSEESLRAVKDVAITYTGIPKEIALGALEVDTLIGDVTIGNINEDILLNTQNANGLVMAKAAEINSNGALASKLTLVRTDDRGPMQIAITGHKSAPYSIDADALMLPWVESATFGLVDKKISWTTTSGGKGNPDGVLVGLALLRGTQTIKWSIIGSVMKRSRLCQHQNSLQLSAVVAVLYILHLTANSTQWRSLGATSFVRLHPSLAFVLRILAPHFEFFANRFFVVPSHGFTMFGV